MQINFYMSSTDRAQFHQFIFDRGGYVAPEHWGQEAIPIVRGQCVALDGQRALKIFKEDVFPASRLSEAGWITPYRSRGGYYVHGPGIQYLASVQDGSAIYRGRLYTGLLSTSSFLKPDEPRSGTASGKAKAEQVDGLKAMKAFYKSCCGYIRQTHRKDDAGFYHGPGSDEAEANGATKLQF